MRRSHWLLGLLILCGLVFAAPFFGPVVKLEPRSEDPDARVIEAWLTSNDFASPRVVSVRREPWAKWTVFARLTYEEGWQTRRCVGAFDVQDGRVILTRYLDAADP
jgi:hypothetical protein